MGEKKNRLANFLSQHPVCCFCGGNEQSTTQDHIPPRCVFDNKKWPEGYVFPACSVCNNNSSESDGIFALVSRLYPAEEESKEVFLETEKLIKAYVEKHPEDAASIILTTNQKRRLAAKHGLKLESGESFGEMPIVQVPKKWIQSVEVVNNKIIKALHYKHTGKIVPNDAYIKPYWWTNAQYELGHFPKELRDLLGNHILIERDNVVLNNQFSYSYQTSEDGRLGLYGAYFRLSFFTIGVVSFDASLIADRIKKKRDNTE